MSVRSEVLIFLGAGASAQLKMPPSALHGKFLWCYCDSEFDADELIREGHFEFFKKHARHLEALFGLLDYEEDKRFEIGDDQRKLFDSCFPGIETALVERRIKNLRTEFDWHSLKLICATKKQSCKDRNLEHCPSTFIQEIFTLIDACLRENRGLSYRADNGEIRLLSVENLRAARQMLSYLEVLMFACAYNRLITDNKEALEPYRHFAETLAKMMQDEGVDLWREDHTLNQRGFYLMSYSIFTTNYEPVFLWLLYQAHKKLNGEAASKIEGRTQSLFIDFPNTLAMRALADGGDETPSSDIWFPITEATVQKINDVKHDPDRLIRLTKYYYVHGSTNFRVCPMCGRVNMHIGDCWDPYTTTVFPPGLIKPFDWGCRPRTQKENAAIAQGEYDMIPCLFCGQPTHTQDNFIYMQSLLKSSAPSFIKEITDEAIAAINGAKHIVLLGYSLPIDDTIWRSMLSAMQRKDSPVYCSVVCGYCGPKQWLYGDELQKHLDKYATDDNTKDSMGIDPIKNAISVFGESNVRAYTGGIPDVFEDGRETAVRELLYPTLPDDWDVSSWYDNGRIIRRKDNEK